MNSSTDSSAKRPLLAFFGHHKCASTWIHSIVDWVCADAGWKLAYLYDEKPFGLDLAGYVAREEIDFVSYVNADAKHVNLRDFRGFHVVRDPRDLIDRTIELCKLRGTPIRLSADGLDVIWKGYFGTVCATRSV